MTGRKTLRLHYSASLLERAKAGSHNFTNVMRRAFQGVGFDIEMVPDSKAARLKTRATSAYSITEMSKPLKGKSLVMRRAYVGAYWRLEKTQERWNFEVAKASYEPDSVDPDLADRFMTLWQKTLFGAAPGRARRGGFILLPLQARLLDRREFQTMAPMQMIDAICREGPPKPIVATLHPGVGYGRDELTALDRLVERHERLTLSKSSTTELLRTCDGIACQNSAAAFQGYFFRKPAILFADIDFQHIASRVSQHGVAGAFAHADEARPDYARYVYWFLKLNSISAGQENAPDQVLEVARARGWDI